jgi:hypothetical protein
MKLPLELRDTIIVLSVDTKSILNVWNSFKDIKWIYYLRSTPDGHLKKHFDLTEVDIRIILKQELSEPFIHYFRNCLDWFSLNQTFSEEFILDHLDCLYLVKVLEKQKISEDTLKVLANTEDLFYEEEWETISKFQDLSEDFMRLFQDHLDWELISEKQYLSEDFIREVESVDLYSVSENQYLSEEFILEFHDHVNLSDILSSQYDLSEKFLEAGVNFFEDDHIDIIVKQTLLSEDFIRKYHHRMDWELVSMWQRLSEEFIREFQDHVDWYWVLKKQKISEDFRKEFEHL